MTDFHHHPDYQAMLRSVLEWPELDEPRLFLADWLADNGWHDRAEFIRLQIQHALEGEPTGDTRQEVDDSWEARERTIAKVTWAEPIAKAFRLDAVALSTYGYGGVSTDWGTVRWEWQRGFINRIRMPRGVMQPGLGEAFLWHPITVISVVPLVYNLTGAVNRFRQAAGLRPLAAGRHEQHDADPATATRSRHLHQAIRRQQSVIR